MSAALPPALRARFQKYIEKGLSGRAAATRLTLSAGTGVRWQRKLRDTGSVAPDIQGRPLGCGKLAAHPAFLEELVVQDDDITLLELPVALEATTGVVAHSASRECHELCVSVPVHSVSDTQASMCSPDIMANWLRAANHSRTFRPSFSNLRMER